MLKGLGTKNKSLFTKFVEANGMASLICEKNSVSELYECKLGFDCESNLLKTKKFEPVQSYSKQELEIFLTNDLGAINTNINDPNKWVIMDKNKLHNQIYSFGQDSEEYHIIKNT